MTYRYPNNSFDVSIFVYILKLDVVLWPLIVSVEIDENADELVVETNRVLDLVAEEQLLIDHVQAWAPNNLIAKRFRLQTEVMKPAREFGFLILDMMAAGNIALGKTDEQVDALIDEHRLLIHILQSGSLSAAYRYFSAMTPSASISAEEIAEYTRLLELELPNLGAKIASIMTS